MGLTEILKGNANVMNYLKNRFSENKDCVVCIYGYEY
jgi:hypothetical protein